MSIKYLQDQQLNQVQQNPNDSPWAKLVAQAEMLERNKMRQPQGQAPQGTVAGTIQQQLMATQQQEGERENADLYKSQMLAQLIGSGQIPANFMSSSQGYADGGLTQPGTGAYRGIMTPTQGYNPAFGPKVPTNTYIPPNSQDPAAQEKKHGMIQSLLDNSIVGMVQGKANIGNAMQDYADLFSGKIFSRGFAEGGDIASLFNRNPNLFNVNDVDPRLKALQKQEASNVARLRSMGHRMNVGNIANENAIPSIPQSMMEKLTAAAKQRPLDAIPYKMSAADRLNAMHRASVQPETASSPSMTEGMSAAAKSPPRIDTMASRMAAVDKANDIKLGDPMAPGATTFEEMATKAKQGLGSLGEAASAVGRPIAKVAGALSPIGDLAMANKFTGGANALLAQALSGQTPSSGMQGDIPEVVKDLTTAPSLPDWAKNLGSAIKSGVPSVPQTDISQFGVDTEAAIPQQPTIGDFSGSVASTPAKGPTLNEKGVIANAGSASKAPVTKENVDVINQVHKQESAAPSTPVDNAVTKYAALAQANQAASKTSDEEGQGSILESLYSKLKDSDVDYSDLAKRISQNEYDLARERKDGTFNAILGGVGAALQQAGTYQGVGDRVFKPGLGAIAGAGILGGLKVSAASDEAVNRKSQDNMMAMLALKKLKRESMNDVLDAISAQRQVDATLRSQGITAQHYADVSKHQAVTEGQENKKIDILGRTADINAAHTNAQIAELASRNPDQKAAIELAQTKANNAERNLASVRSGAHMPDDPIVANAQKEYDNAMATLNYLLQSLKVPVAPAGSASPVRGPNDIKVLSREAIK